MENPLWDRMKDSIAEGSYFTQTLSDAALDIIGEIDKSEIVNVAVVGDTTITNVPAIMRAFASLARYFGDRELYQVLVGDMPGVEEVIVRACKKNDVKYVQYRLRQREDIEWPAPVVERNRNMLKNAHVVLVITDGQSKETDSMYREAREAGLIVMKRIIRKKS